MAPHINSYELKNFILDQIGKQDFTANRAREFDIEQDTFDEADENDDTILDIDEIMDSDDIVVQFTTLYNIEQEKKSEAKDKEKQKEDDVAITGKNQATA